MSDYSVSFVLCPGCASMLGTGALTIGHDTGVSIDKFAEAIRDCPRCKTDLLALLKEHGWAPK